MARKSLKAGSKQVKGSTKKVGKKVTKTLKKEVHLPIKTPDTKTGNALSKKRRIPFAAYVSDSWTEIKRVVWPSRKESFKLTFAVIIFTAIFTLILALADVGISNVVERVLL